VVDAYTSHGSEAAALGRQQKPASLDESGREFCVFVDAEAKRSIGRVMTDVTVDFGRATLTR
jgi:hypothetical protein